MSTSLKSLVEIKRGSLSKRKKVKQEDKQERIEKMSKSEQLVWVQVSHKHKVLVLLKLSFTFSQCAKFFIIIYLDALT